MTVILGLLGLLALVLVAAAALPVLLAWLLGSLAEVAVTGASRAAGRLRYRLGRRVTRKGRLARRAAAAIDAEHRALLTDRRSR